MTTSRELAALNTNVLVYALYADAEHHRAARPLVDHARNPDAALCLTPQVLAELYAVVTNPRRVVQAAVGNPKGFPSGAACLQRSRSRGASLPVGKHVGRQVGNNELRYHRPLHRLLNDSTPETAAMREGQATAYGLSVEAYLRGLLALVSAEDTLAAMSDAEFDALMDEFAKGTEHVPPLPPDCSQDDIYADHD